MGAQERRNQRERLHPAVYGTVLLILVSVGRLPELFQPLGMLQLGNVAAALGLFGLLIAKWKNDVPVFATSTGRLLAGFTVLAGLSIGFSVWNGQSLEVFLNNLLTNMVMFFLIARSANSVRMLRIYTGALGLAAALLSAEAVIGYTQGRVEVGMAYDANDLAMVLVTILPIVVAALLFRGGLWRLIWLTVAGLMLVTILLTGSRGGILGLAAVVGFLLVARFPNTAARKRGSRLSAAKVGIIGLGAVMAMAAAPQLTIERMSSLTNLESDYNMVSERGRLAVWGRGLDAFASRPWGHGLGTFVAVDMNSGGTWQAAHNIWLEVGVELGVLGVLILFGLFWTVARTSSRVGELAFVEMDARGRKEAPSAAQLASLAVAMKGCLIGFFVTSFFLSVALTGVFFTLLALTAALEHQERTLAENAPWPGEAAGKGRRIRGRRAAARGAGAHGPAANGSAAYGGASFAQRRAHNRRRS